ncbi:DnaJ sub C member 10 [Aphanomyces cochlioides]|nr:DnaJ sub C member 10 [Aphanomyces cochlioides]
MRVQSTLLLVLLLAIAAWAEDLYEILGASSSATPQDLKRIYRKLSLKYHPDKVAPEERDAAQARFLEIANAYRVLSDPARREKYDLYGIADDEGFKNFDEAFKHAHDSVEDTPLNWFILITIVGLGIGPILYFKLKPKPKPVNNARREALAAKKKSPKDN